MPNISPRVSPPPCLIAIDAFVALGGDDGDGGNGGNGGDFSSPLPPRCSHFVRACARACVSACAARRVGCFDSPEEKSEEESLQKPSDEEDVVKVSFRSCLDGSCLAWLDHSFSVTVIWPLWFWGLSMNSLEPSFGL